MRRFEGLGVDESESESCGHLPQVRQHRGEPAVVPPRRGQDAGLAGLLRQREGDLIDRGAVGRRQPEPGELSDAETVLPKWGVPLPASRRARGFPVS